MEEATGSHKCSPIEKNKEAINSKDYCAKQSFWNLLDDNSGIGEKYPLADNLADYGLNEQHFITPSFDASVYNLQSYECPNYDGFSWDGWQDFQNCLLQNNSLKKDKQHTSLNAIINKLNLDLLGGKSPAIFIGPQSVVEWEYVDESGIKSPPMNDIEIHREKVKKKAKKQTCHEKSVKTAKRSKHVGKACTHCKKAHLACDNERPCSRCRHLNREYCVDVEHKKRGRPRSIMRRSNDDAKNRTLNVENMVELDKLMNAEGAELDDKSKHVQMTDIEWLGVQAWNIACSSKKGSIETIGSASEYEKILQGSALSGVTSSSSKHSWHADEMVWNFHLENNSSPSP